MVSATDGYDRTVVGIRFLCPERSSTRIIFWADTRLLLQFALELLVLLLEPIKFLFLLSNLGPQLSKLLHLMVVDELVFMSLLLLAEGALRLGDGALGAAAGGVEASGRSKGAGNAAGDGEHCVW
jgi:hypothetical protein